MSNPCLILEWSDAINWTTLIGEVRRIPGQPTMLQPDRATAEAEAQRLASRHPDKRFAIFEACVEARTTEVPSHVTVGGEVWMTRRVPVLVEDRKSVV